MLRVERRAAPSLTWQFASPVLAIGLAVGTGAWLLALQDLPVAEILHAFLLAPLLDGYGRLELLGKATPLIVCALGLAVCYRAKLWNIGAEGQFILGALAGGALALNAEAWPSWLSLPAILAADVAAGSGTP